MHHCSGRTCSLLCLVVCMVSKLRHAPYSDHGSSLDVCPKPLAKISPFWSNSLMTNRSGGFQESLWAYFGDGMWWSWSRITIGPCFFFRFPRNLQMFSSRIWTGIFQAPCLASWNMQAPRSMASKSAGDVWANRNGYVPSGVIQHCWNIPIYFDDFPN